jgi:hypothetical protein
MSENAIDRLKNRQRPKVDKRDASLEQNFELDLEEDVKKTEPNLEINSNVTQFSNSVIESNSKNQNDYLLDLDIEPIRRSIRLTPKIDEDLDKICRENKITRDTLFEAALTVCSNNQALMKKVIKEAQERYKERKRIGEFRKLKTMKQKFES